MLLSLLFIHTDDQYARPWNMDTLNSVPSVLLRDHYDYLAKVIIVGGSSTGKTSLLHRFIQSDFPRDPSQTIGVEFNSKLCVVDEHVKIKLQLWDTAGQERFKSLTRSYYRSSAGVIMVFDLADLTTLERLQEYWYDIQELIHSPSVVLVGNKSDLEHTITDEQVHDRVRAWGSDSGTIKFIRTSAKEGINVNEPFQFVTESIWNRIESGAIDVEDQSSGVQYGDLPWNTTLSSSHRSGQKIRRATHGISLDEPLRGENTMNTNTCSC